MTAVDAYVVHWNAPEWCAETVEALLASAGVEVSVTVINNGGQLQLPPGVRVIDVGENVGYAGGHNIGLSQPCSAPFTFVGCHDIRLDPAALAAMVATLEADPGLALVGPVLNGEGGTDRDLEWISGSGWLMRSDLRSWRFDERFSSYAEDLDFCFRLREGTGMRVGRAGDAQAITRGSSDPDRADFLTHANTLTWFAARGAWRLFLGRVKILLRLSIRRPRYLRALAAGLLQTVLFRFRTPDRLTSRWHRQRLTPGTEAG